MKKVKNITTFALALLLAGSISITSKPAQAKALVYTTEIAQLAASKNKLTGTNIVDYAKTFTGIPYKYGGTTTAGFDCSGFTMHVYNNFKVNLPRIASSQTSKGSVVSKSTLKKGDLVFFGNPVYHVGIYVGNGKFIHSPKTGSSIKIIDLKYMPNYNTARRITSN
ncbi:C40 family peptidase [Clostridium estertheticum]|uniref:C40 family peptidase n=1 Tax=Clostridium estertheticum TaxID=238834 RepID=UPI001C6E0250|nr:C40 family peptidase [Clostridium estertheticum]MBW9151608.1 C40 family peptidase [Clostridium estertheticum]WLC83263.1 C40 family peptidase [Clostridium estertheticum]